MDVDKKIPQTDWQPVKVASSTSNLAGFLSVGEVLKEKAKKYPLEKLYDGQLKQTGRILQGKCPFHEDENPSFAIYPETNSWYCFACGEGGDVFDFYMKKRGIDFKQAIKELA